MYLGETLAPIETNAFSSRTPTSTRKKVINILTSLCKCVENFALVDAVSQHVCWQTDVERN